MQSLKKTILFVISIAVFVSSLTLGSSLSVYGEQQGSDSLVSGNVSINDENSVSYEKYFAGIKNNVYPEANIIVPAANYASMEVADLKVNSELQGEKNVLEWVNQDGSVEWEADIAQEGNYTIGIKYLPLKGKNADIEFAFEMDGKPVFDEAQRLIFFRSWKDGNKITRDNRGNEITPTQVEEPIWMEADLRDNEGLYNDSYKFYFAKGKHRLTLKSLKEPCALSYIRIYNKTPVLTYDEIIKKYEENGYKSSKNFLVKIQAERPLLKSSPVIHPISDRSGPATEPYHPSKIRLNTIGGINWKYCGQWVTWEVEVPEDALYQIATRFKQDTVRGFFVSRRIYIDGVVPFKEFENQRFDYSSKWQMEAFGNKDPQLVYLTKGKHEIKMEVTLGEMSQTLRTIQESVFQMNNLYRKIIMITGVNPDTFRDYYLEKEIPDLVPKMKELSKILDEERKRIETVTGFNGSEASILQQISNQMANMAEKPESIAERLSNYRDNVSALAAWILRIKEQPLELDYIIVASPDQKLPKANAGFLRNTIHELRAFVASFFENYNNVGNVYAEDKSIKVWVGMGRDQAQIIKGMVDDMFTPKTGISVNLSLVQGALLQATLAGKGPDVALNMGRGDPVNLAVRGAVVALDDFNGFDEIGSRFMPTAMVPYKYLDKHYALPETQSFHMMFYRKDIFKELGIKPPKTWQELYKIMPVIQRNNMEVGLPYYSANAFDLIGMGMGAQTIFPALLFQHNSDIYTEDQKKTKLYEPDSITAFEEWTGFYTHYSFPLFYDFYNRFRTGEMPLGIAFYAYYNFFSIAAPEIRNLWEMVPIPGTLNEDGSINRAQAASGSACMIMSNAKDKNASWEFIKWWTSAEVQNRFGREQEAILGPAARYNPANIEAFESLPWSGNQQKTLMEQWKQVREIPEVPGGYYTSRNLDNAFRTVVFNWANPREVLYYWNKETNDEITRKRIEFGIDK